MICKRTALARDATFLVREEDGQRYIEGYFAVFGREYYMWDNAVEIIEAGAFTGELGGDVRALINHDSTLVLGRTTAGTLELREDPVGLWGRIAINSADQDAVNLHERVKRRDVSQCSFGFNIVDQDIEEMPDGKTVWRIKKVQLYEVSVVTFPAYPETGVEARRRDLEDQKKRKKAEWRKKMNARLKGE